MKKVESLLECKLDDISIVELKTVKEKYFELLEKHKFPKPPADGDFSEMIHYFKRKDETNPIAIGPYKNITPFEAANRIASDLVIINGLLQLVDSEPGLVNAKFTLRLGTTYIKNKGDFTIETDVETLEGEAFNVAPSFLKDKLAKTIKKWSQKEKLKYILVNNEAFEHINIQILDNRVFKVKKWDKDTQSRK